MKTKTNDLVVIIISLLFSCRPNHRCDFVGTHEFVIPSTLTPAIDTFSLGDTIYFSSIFKERIYDRALDDHVILSNFKFNPATYLIALDTTIEVFVLDDFKVLINDEYDYKIRYSDRGKYFTSAYTYDDENYQLEFKIIPMKKGHYLFNHILLLNLSPGQTFEGICPNKGSFLDSYSNLNDTADNNILLLKYSPNTYYNESVFNKPDEWFHSKGGYCFFVKE